MGNDKHDKTKCNTSRYFNFSGGKSSYWKVWVLDLGFRSPGAYVPAQAETLPRPATVDPGLGSINTYDPIETDSMKESK
jgi:hypothetical protein